MVLLHELSLPFSVSRDLMLTYRVADGSAIYRYHEDLESRLGHMGKLVGKVGLLTRLTHTC